jgi:hypothetical protein
MAYSVNRFVNDSEPQLLEALLNALWIRILWKKFKAFMTQWIMA